MHHSENRVDNSLTMVRGLKNRAARLVEQGRNREAAQVLAQLVDMDRSDPWVRLRCAEAHLRAEDFPKAEAWFIETAKAFVSRGQLRQARAVIAAASRQLGREIDAVDVLRAKSVFKGSAPPPYLVESPKQDEPIEIEIVIEADPPRLVIAPVSDNAPDLIDQTTFDELYSQSTRQSEEAQRFFAALSYPRR